jgi:hypothetical protein
MVRKTFLQSMEHAKDTKHLFQVWRFREGKETDFFVGIVERVNDDFLEFWDRGQGKPATLALSGFVCETGLSAFGNCWNLINKGKCIWKLIDLESGCQ